MPDGAGAWTADARRVLGESRPNQDSTLEYEGFILATDSGDWNSHVVTYWCLVDTVASGVAGANRGARIKPSYTHSIYPSDAYRKEPRVNRVANK